MQLDNDTLDILKNFATINPSLAVKQGNTIKTISLTNSVIAKAKLQQSFPNDFAIYDLSSFLSAMSMFDNPNLDFSNGIFATIANDETNASVRYFFADTSTVIKPPEKEMPVPDTEIKFHLSKATLADIIKAVSVLSLPEIAFVGDGKHTSIQAIDPKNPTSNLYKKIIGDTKQEFTAYFKIENIKLFPNDYDVSISTPRSKGVPGIALFASPSIEYWVAVELHSTF